MRKRYRSGSGSSTFAITPEAIITPSRRSATMPVMALTDPYRVLIALARSGQALRPDDLGLILDWPIERVHATLRKLVASRLMPVAVDATGAYRITLSGLRRMRSFPPRADRHDDDEPDDAA